jgi:hypothetical protein
VGGLIERRTRLASESASMTQADLSAPRYWRGARDAEALSRALLTCSETPELSFHRFDAGEVACDVRGLRSARQRPIGTRAARRTWLHPRRRGEPSRPVSVCAPDSVSRWSKGIRTVNLPGAGANLPQTVCRLGRPQVL